MLKPLHSSQYFISIQIFFSVTETVTDLSISVGLFKHEWWYWWYSISVNYWCMVTEDNNGSLEPAAHCWGGAGRIGTQDVLYTVFYSCYNKNSLFLFKQSSILV